MKPLIAVSVAALRRSNSAAMVRDAREAVTGPTRLIAVARTMVMPSAASDRDNTGRRTPNKHTSPKAPASRRLHPRARLLKALAGAACVVTSTASPIHTIARYGFPPAHQPTSAQAATAG